MKFKPITPLYSNSQRKFYIYNSFERLMTIINNVTLSSFFVKSNYNVVQGKQDFIQRIYFYGLKFKNIINKLKYIPPLFEMTKIKR